MPQQKIPNSVECEQTPTTSPHSSNEKIHRKCPLPKVGRLHRKQVRQIQNELLDFLIRILWVMPQTLVWTIFPKSEKVILPWKLTYPLNMILKWALFRGKWVNFGELILVPTFEIPSATMKPIVLSYSASTVQLQPPQGITYHKPQPRCRSWGNTRWAPFWASRIMDDLSEQIWLWLLLNA